MNISKEEQEAKEAAKQFWIEYFKAPKGYGECNEMTIDCMAKFLSDFQTALIEALNE